MNPEFPTDPRQALEVSLTALLLGELPPDQAEFLQKAMAQDQELARMHERLKQTIGLVRETEHKPVEQPAPPPEALRLAEDRRQRLLQHFKTVSPTEFEEVPRRRFSWIVPAGAAAVLLALVGASLLPALSKAKSRGMRAAFSQTDVMESGRTILEALKAPPPAQESFRQLKGAAPSPAPSVPAEVPKTTIVLPASRDEGRSPALVTANGAFAVHGVGDVSLGYAVLADGEKPNAPASPPPGAIAMTPISTAGGGGGAGGTLDQGMNMRSKQGNVGFAKDSVDGFSPSSLQEGLRNSGDAAKTEESLSVPRVNVAGGGGIGRGLPAPLRPAPSDSRAFLGLSTNFINAGVLGGFTATQGTMQRLVEAHLEQPAAEEMRMRYGLARSPATAGKPEAKTPEGAFPRTESVTAIDPATGLPVPLGEVGGSVTAIDPATGLLMGADKKDASVASIDPNTGLPVAAGKPTPQETAVNEAVLRQADRIASQQSTTGAPMAPGTPAQSATAPSFKGAPLSVTLRGFFDGTTPSESQDMELGKALAEAPPFAATVGGREDHSDRIPILGDKPAIGRVLQTNAAVEFIPQSGAQRLQQLRLKSEPAQQTPAISRPWPGGDNKSKLFLPDQFVENGKLEQKSDSTKKEAHLGQLADNRDAVRAYAEARQQLEELLKVRNMLYLKSESEGADLKVPKTSNVEIIDQAAATPIESPSLGARLRRAFGGEVERKARIKIERDSSDMAGRQTATLSAAYDPYFVQTENEVIQSEAVLGKVVDDLKLDEAWARKTGRSDKLSKGEAVQRLKGMLNLKSVPNSSLLDIGVKSDQPEEAAKLANTIAQEFQNHRNEERRKLALGGIEALTNRLSEVEAKVQETQKQVDDLGGKLHFEQFAQGATPAYTTGTDSAAKLKELRAQAQAEIARQTALLQQLKNSTPDQLAVTLPASGVQDTLLLTYLEEITILEQKLTASKQFGPASPETIRIGSQLDEMKRKSAEQAQGLVTVTEAKVTSLKRSVDRLDAELAKADRDEPAPRPASRGLEPQPEVDTRENAFSTFSLNVSDVSFKLAAASLEKGALPDPASIRSEEFINAFDYRDPEAPAGVPVAFAWDRARYPFAQNRDLLRFSIETAAQGRQAGQPLNLVLLLDNSGSMERADRVQIIREALRVLASQLQAQDRLSVITFARTAQLRVDGVPGSQAGQVAEEVSGLTPQGGTNLEEAMNLAYQTALKHYLANGINRVVLLTDGAANLGDVEPENLKKKVEDHRKQGIALDCFGIGWEGYNDDLLEVLSRNGDGRYGFINTPEEASTEFAAQLAGALHVAASDVKVQVEFNPKRVTAWRQIGYTKHQLTKEQFRDNTVDAAEIGAAEAGNALYTAEVNPRGEGELGTVRVRYKIPGTTDYREHEWVVPYNGTAAPLEQSSPAIRLAASASAFSEWLATSPFAAEVTPDALLGYLSGVPEIYGADARPKKLEWMIRQAKSLSGK